MCVCVCGCGWVCVCVGVRACVCVRGSIFIMCCRINMHVCKQMFVAPCALFVRFMLLGVLYCIVYMRLG